MSAKPTLPVEALSLNIDSYVACTKCAEELASIEPKISLQDYAAIDIGFTNGDYRSGVGGIRSILYILILAAQLPADFRRLEKN